MSTTEFSQLAMVHRLPRAAMVDRIEFLCDATAGRRVVHVGFVDAGCRTLHARAGAWLHEHLDRRAASLVGIDLDEEGVRAARAAGYEAYVADCRRPDELRAIGLEPADVVVAGEIIEHLDDAGSFLDGLHALVGPTGRLVLTTPNADGLLNVGAALVGYEVNHPDHVAMFTWRTLTNLLARHGWQTVETATFVPTVKDLSGSRLRLRLLALGARAVLALERGLGRVGRPFAADGLIVVARPARDDDYDDGSSPPVETGS